MKRKEYSVLAFGEGMLDFMGGVMADFAEQLSKSGAINFTCPKR